MRILIILIFLSVTLFSFFLKYLTYSMRNAPLPENVKDVYNENEYKKNQEYKMDKLKFSIVSGIIGMITGLFILLFNIHHNLYEFILQYTANIYFTGLFIMLVPIIGLIIIGLPMGVYDTFVIEEKYGFNKTTVRTFILDTIKSLLIMFVIVSGLLSLFFFLHSLLDNMVFFVFFFVLMLFGLFMKFISPLMIRIFYKLTPLEESGLKERIEKFAQETGYKLQGIYMVDASRRSTKLNAFASGFGKTKTIGLFDTLLEKMTDDEIMFILAHEIGHAKKHHILKSYPLGLLSSAIMLTAAYFIITMPETSQAFGFYDVNLAFGIFIVSIILSPLMLLLGIPENAISRKHEYEADAFGKQYFGLEPAVSGLKKLYKEDLGNLTPHPFVVMIDHSHPPLTQRIKALGGA